MKKYTYDEVTRMATELARVIAIHQLLNDEAQADMLRLAQAWLTLDEPWSHTPLDEYWVTWSRVGASLLAALIAAPLAEDIFRRLRRQTKRSDQGGAP